MTNGLACKPCRAGESVEFRPNCCRQSASQLKRGQNLISLFVVILLLSAGQSGCAIDRKHVPLILPPSARLVEIQNPIKKGNGGDFADVLPVSSTVTPRNVLVLSGGGANGAYTAGVLNGWTASGTRPEFDVVTGISTGALIAPFAFLGPDYDDTLHHSYTTSEEGEVFKRRWLLSLAWSDSLADSTPLRNKIEDEITPPVLNRIAEAHRAGRRLYVGSTDLDSKRLVVWDIGAIACSDNPRKLKLVHDVLLASASIPGLLPPVEISINVDGKKHTELHVDGSVASALFLRPDMLEQATTGSLEQAGQDKQHVHVIVAGSLQLPQRAVKRQLTKVVGESIGGVLQSQLEGDLLKTYLVSRQAGAQFALTSVPKQLAAKADPLAFDPERMKQLFETGYQQAVTGKGWQHAPDSLSPTDHTPPRTGLRFTVQAAAETSPGSEE